MERWNSAAYGSFARMPSSERSAAAVRREDVLSAQSSRFQIAERMRARHVQIVQRVSESFNPFTLRAINDAGDSCRGLLTTCAIAAPSSACAHSSDAVVAFACGDVRRRLRAHALSNADHASERAQTDVMTHEARIFMGGTSADRDQLRLYDEHHDLTGSSGPMRVKARCERRCRRILNLTR